ARRYRRADARREHQQDRRHHRRRCAGCRGIHRQLPLFGSTPGGTLMRVLLLGGTAEGRALAETLHPDVDVISSLAGRVPDPALPVGAVRIGGFGGVDGLRRWLRDERIDAVVDATHPFAATMTAHAAEACNELG